MVLREESHCVDVPSVLVALLTSACEGAELPTIMHWAVLSVPRYD